MHGLDKIVHGFVGELLDKSFEVPAGLLDPFVLVGDARFFLCLIERFIGLVGVLLDEVDDGGDASLVLWVVLGLGNDLLQSLDDLVPRFLAVRELVVQVALDFFDFIPQAFGRLSLQLARPSPSSSLFPFLLELVKVDALLTFLLARPGGFGGLLGLVGGDRSRIGKDVAREEDHVGAELAERGAGDDQRSDGAEGLDGALSIT